MRNKEITRMARPLLWAGNTILRQLLVTLHGCQGRLTGEPSEFVLALAHMRSGSTLLHHLLISHPQMTGCGERNAAYASPRDFGQLILDACWLHRRFFRKHRYFVDQVNHNRFLVSEDLLHHPRVRVIFLIREPETSIASMVDVLGKFYGMTMDEAVEYYTDRLSTLARYAQIMDSPASAFFLTYSDLVGNTNPTLQSLQRFLGLDTGFSENYQVFGFTGRRGDPSENARRGRIVRDIPRRQSNLPPEVLVRTRHLYDDCRRVLEKHCKSNSSLL